MDVLYAFSVIAIWLLACLAARFITTFVHEMGHAMPALLFTKKEVVVFIGSYGEKEIKNGIKIGRLVILINKNIIRVNGGMCAYFEIPTATQSLIIALGGPFASLISCVLLILFLSISGWSDGFISLASIFVLSFIWDFIVNIIPVSSPHMMASGQVLYNDGAQIQQSWQERKVPSEYYDAQKLWKTDQKADAISLMEDIVSKGYHSRVVYRQLLEYLYQNKQYNLGIKNFEKYAHHQQMKAPDYFLLGQMQLESGDLEDALKSSREATHLDYSNAFYLNLQGNVMNKMGEYKSALLKFNGAIQHNLYVLESYFGRALSFVRLDQMAEARADLEFAQKIIEAEEGELNKDIEKQKPTIQTLLKDQFNKKAASLALHYGFYYQALGQKIAAMEQFEKAKELGSQHHGLDYFIADLKERTNW